MGVTKARLWNACSQETRGACLGEPAYVSWRHPDPSPVLVIPCGLARQKLVSSRGAAGSV